MLFLFCSCDGASSRQLLFHQLEALSTIREITGYLLIDSLDHYNFTNLRFLRRLMVIQGQETLELRPGQHYSLAVINNPHLQTANFGSLISILEGGVRITNNPELCLIDTIRVEQFLVSSSLRRVGGLGQNCNGFACHAECDVLHGCWGTLADECVQCSHYQHLGTCVPACNLSISYINETSLQCIPFPSNTQSEEPTITSLSSTGTATTAPEQTIPTLATSSGETPPLYVVTTTTTLQPTSKQIHIWVIASTVTTTIILSTSIIAGIAVAVYVCHRKKFSMKQSLKKSGSPIKYSGNNDTVQLVMSEGENSVSHKQKRQRASLSSLAREGGIIGSQCGNSPPLNLDSRQGLRDVLQDHVMSHDTHMTAYEKHMISQRESKILAHQSNNQTATTHAMPPGQGKPPQFLTTRGKVSTSPRLSNSHKPNERPIPEGGVYATRHTHNSAYPMRRGSSSHGTSTRTSFSSYRHSMTSSSGLSSVRTVTSTHGSENSLPVSPDQSPRVM